MLLIDITKQQVHKDNNYDQDVVIVKGASTELINSLSGLASIPRSDFTQDGGCDGHCKHTGKVAMQPKFSRTVPTSIKAQSLGSFDETFAKLGKILNELTTKPQASVTFKAVSARRLNLQAEIAEALIKDSAFIEALRAEAQANHTFLNPNAHTVTTRNIQAAVALYAYYSNDRGFSSTLGSSVISKQVQVTSDTIARLATELGLLRKTGASTATRYFIKPVFAQTLINVLRRPRYTATLAKVDAIQNEIDALGSV